MPVVEIRWAFFILFYEKISIQIHFQKNAG